MKDLALILAAGLLVSCDGCAPATTPDPDEGKPDPTLFALEVLAEEFIELSIEGETVRAAPDLVLVGLTQDANDADYGSIAALVDGALVGQLPALGLLQIQVRTRTQAGLDAAIAVLTADARVAFAGYDLELSASEGVCPVDNDNQRLEAEFRCFYQDIEMDTAMTLLKHLEADLEWNPVKLGIVDSGINHVHPEFEDIRIYDAHGVGGAVTDQMQDKAGHGTKVAAMMVADDDGDGIAGLASSVLGDRLTLVFGKMTGQLFPTIISVHRVLHAGSQIVNMSFGVNRNLGNRQLQFEWAGFARLMAAWPEVLFVAAAPNRPFVLTGMNHMPGGMPAPNLITVGGTKACSIATPYVDSARGPSNIIQIAAPAQNVVTIDVEIGNILETKSGNSIATPQVSSVAAILLSLVPDLTPTEVRDQYIQRMSNFGPPEVGGRVLTVPYVVGQLLLERVASTAVLAVVDANEDGVLDTTNTMIQSICGGRSWYIVEGEDTFTATSTDEAMGSGNTTMFNLTFVHQPHAFGLSCNDCPFDLGVFPVLPPAATAPDTAFASYSFAEGNKVVQGQGQSGGFLINACSITGRTVEPQTSSIVYELVVQGRFGGDMEITTSYLNPLSTETHMSTFTGAFDLPWLFNLPSETDALALRLEQKCENGRSPPSSPATELLGLPELAARWGVSRTGADARRNGIATPLSAEQAVAWVQLETPLAGTGTAFHLALLESAAPAGVGDSVVVNVLQPDCTAQTEPACAQSGGIALGLYTWVSGHATRALQGVSGQVTLEQTSAQVLRATLDVTFDDGSQAQGWNLRMIE
ncbi:MAG: S8 family serine peptidase [Pseudomonadota bacterium]